MNNYNGGTIHSLIVQKLSIYDEYLHFRANKIDLAEYEEWLRRNINNLIDDDISHHMIMLSARTPRKHDYFVRLSLSKIFANGAKLSNDHIQGGFESFKNYIANNYEHESYSTYIFPEESELLYKYSMIKKPKKVLIAGSYYGYLGVWALPAIKKYGGKALFIDIDPDVCDVSRKNIEMLGFSDIAEVVNEDAIEYIDNLKCKYDLIIIDAEGNHDNQDSDRRGKRIYYPLIKSSTKVLERNGVIFMHNIMLSTHNKSPYLQTLVEKHYQDFEKFLPFVEQNYKYRIDLPSTEGLGLYFNEH